MVLQCKKLYELIQYILINKEVKMVNKDAKVCLYWVIFVA